MKTTMKIFTIALMASSLFLTSCSKDGEDGEDGTIGLQGEQGMPGADGTDGVDGVDGLDGEDGNANVSSFKFDITAASGTSHQLNNTTAATFVEDGGVLAYVRAGDIWYQVPNQRIFTNALSFIDIASEFVPNVSPNNYFFKLNFLRDGLPFIISAGDLDELRLILISSSNSTSGKSSSNNIMDKLYEKGVDPSDYYQVMEHFNLKE